MAETVPLNRKAGEGAKPPQGMPPKEPQRTPYWRKLLLGEWED